MIDTITQCKLIIMNEINAEIGKKRDIHERGESFDGPISNGVSATLLIVETEVEKKFSRLRKGESIYTILPSLETAEKYDRPDEDLDIRN